jgi:DNA-binding IclR family transcriptional regulator
MLFDGGRPVRVIDASAALGVARSTAHRLLTTLEHRGFVRQDPMTRAYLVGDTLMHLGGSGSWDRRLEEVALPELTALVARVNETAHIAILRGANAHFIMCVESTETVRVCSHVGTGLPAYATASGKALLAQLDEIQLRELYSEHALVPMRKNTIRSWSELRTVLADVRRRGYATNFSESEFGVNGVGVAITANDQVYGAIVVTGSSTRFRRQHLAASAVECKRAADRIASCLAPARVVPSSRTS